MRPLPARREIVDSGRIELDAVDQDVPALAVPPDDGHALTLGGVQPIRDSGFEALIKKRDLEVVAHPTINSDERDGARA